jgi:hypothetical protein
VDDRRCTLRSWGNCGHERRAFLCASLPPRCDWAPAAGPLHLLSVSSDKERIYRVRLGLGLNTDIVQGKIPNSESERHFHMVSWGFVLRRVIYRIYRHREWGVECKRLSRTTSEAEKTDCLVIFRFPVYFGSPLNTVPRSVCPNIFRIFGSVVAEHEVIACCTCFGGGSGSEKSGAIYVPAASLPSSAPLRR